MSEIYITPETFPQCQRALLSNELYLKDNELHEVICVEWSRKGRCKIYDVTCGKTFWTDVKPNITIVEYLEALKFECPYDIAPLKGKK